MPVRIYDIAKKLGLENRVVISKAKQLGITAAKVASSALDKYSAEYLEEQLLISLGGERGRGLRSIRLGNFKAFAEAQTVPIRPLTLIFGANSSGKSSVIHAMLLTGEALRTGRLDIFKTKAGGDAIDLGGFRQYVHRRELTRRMELSAELKAENLQGNAFAVLGTAKQIIARLSVGIELDNTGMSRPGSTPELVSYEIEVDGQSLARLSRRKAGTMQIDRLNVEAFKPLVRALLLSMTTTGTVVPEDEFVITNAMERLVPELRFECEKLLPDALIGHDYGLGTMQQLAPIRKDSRVHDLSNQTRMFIPGAIAEVLRGVNAALRSQMERLAYLGPLRSFPPRHLAFIEDSDPNWFAGGGYAWDAVRRDEKLREKVNEWLGSKERLQTPYRLVVERLFTASEVQSSLGPGVGGLVPDIVGRIIDEALAEKTDTGKLLATQAEIETERGKVSGQLDNQAGANRILHERLAAIENSLTESLAKLEKLQMQRNVLAHGGSTDASGSQAFQQIETELASAQRQAQTSREIRDIIQDIYDHGIKGEAELTENLKKLEAKKAEVFSEFQANLDEQDLAKRLYEAIQIRSDRSAVDELMLVDCRTETAVTHRDVGIGVSQVLPVLVHAYADKGKIVAIEQPEIHLHPALQSELGDLFIESALGERKNTFILETHSEHLILRILRRVRDTTENKLPPGMPPVRPEDVTVVFVEPTSKGSVVRHLPVTPDGDFGAEWPGGFFAERFKDLP